MFMWDRIFVPSEKNALVDLLLARSVTGESPNKAVTSSMPKEKQPPTSLVRAGHNNKSTAKKPSKRKAKAENKVEVEGGERFEAGRSTWHFLACLSNINLQ